MLTIYGCDLCPDCVACKKDLDQAGVAYTYLDITAELPRMKEFLKLRDTCEVFADVKAEGRIGIPCIVEEEGRVSLSWEDYK